MPDFDGPTYEPGHDRYDDVRQPWKLTVEQYPALVVAASTVEDVKRALHVVRSTGRPFSVQATGHGVVHPCDDGILLNLALLDQVEIDPERSVARVAAGARWRDVLKAAHQHGLAGLSGTAPSVGAVGYSLGGGVGLLHRTYGFAADSILSATVVLADGSTVRADADQHPDLFWALKGGGGNFGVVTELEIRLYQVATVHSGMLIYPGDAAREILRGYADWTHQISEQVTSGALVMRLPPLPTLPENLRGQHIVALRGTVANGDPKPFDELRSAFGEPLMDSFTTGSYLNAALSSMEPEDPSPVESFAGLLNSLDPAVIDRLVDLTAPESPLMGIEVRHAGGKAAEQPASPSALSHRDAPYTLGLQAAIPDQETAGRVKDFVPRAFESLKDDLHPGNFLNFLPSGTSTEQVRTAFSAESYARLREVKKRYDPQDIFRFGQHIPPAAS